MTVTAVTPTIITLEEAQKYLRDQGVRDGNADHLQRIVNGVTAECYEITGRTRILDDDSVIVEYRDGDGTSVIFTDEHPVTSLSLVTRWPHETSLVDTITGPGTNLSNDDMLYDRESGKIELKEKYFPAGNQTVVLIYKAGHADGDHEIEGLRLVLLEQVHVRWQKFIEKPGILSTREAGDDRWTFKKDAEIRSAWVRSLRPWRNWQW